MKRSRSGSVWIPRCYGDSGHLLFLWNKCGCPVNSNKRYGVSWYSFLKILYSNKIYDKMSPIKVGTYFIYGGLYGEEIN